MSGRLLISMLAGGLAAPWAWAAAAPPSTNALAGDAAAGRKVYVGKCARCHELYEPSQYNDAAWQGWMTRMQRKARLSDDQYRALLA